MKAALQIGIGLYFIVGAFFALTLGTAIPAINVIGRLYIAVTWPFWLKGSPVTLPIFSFMFSF